VARFFLVNVLMYARGRLAGVLNGIVISTLSACGGTSEGDHGQSGGANSTAGGDAVVGGTSNDSGAGGRLQMGGSNFGGGTVITAGGAISAGGAGTAGTGADVNVSVMSKPLCDEKGLLRFVDGLHLPEAVDYLGVYLSQGSGNNTLYQSTGTQCAGASDKPACQAAMVAGTPSAGFPYLYLPYPTVTSTLPSYVYMYVAYTHGDSVGFIEDRDQLNAFLGEIDSANEAGLVFLSMGVAPACNGISETPDAYYYSTPFVSVGCSMTPPGRAFSVTRSGAVTSMPFPITTTPCVGRRPVGLSSAQIASTTPLGDYYASIAHLEGAAVLAFETMGRELKRFGAPPELQLRAQRARADEERHYALMAAIARREGATVPCVHAVRRDDRSLLEAALENAIEGCVREAWGALSAHYQATTAADAEARQLWQGIARDESEHAELSLALHHWFMLQLAAAERELVEGAMRQARLDLRSELRLGPAPHPAVARHAGAPEPACAAALFAELERHVLETVVRLAA